MRSWLLYFSSISLCLLHVSFEVEVHVIRSCYNCTDEIQISYDNGTTTKTKCSTNQTALLTADGTVCISNQVIKKAAKKRKKLY